MFTDVETFWNVNLHSIKVFSFILEDLFDSSELLLIYSFRWQKFSFAKFIFLLPKFQL